MLLVGAQEIRRCSFCKRTQGQVAKLISSPEPPVAYICDECVWVWCDECVLVCLNVIGDAPRRSGRFLVNKSHKSRCSFCFKGSDIVRLQSSSDPPNASICEECIQVCISILQDDMDAMFSGMAVGLRASAVGVSLTAAETGLLASILPPTFLCRLPASGHCLSRSVASVNVAGIASADVLSSSTSESGRSSQSQSTLADVNLLNGL